MLITIDPGACTGWAVWDDDGLMNCGIFEAGSDSMPVRPNGTYSVWIEYPVIYPRSKARPSDILTLAKIAAQYGGAYREMGCVVTYVEPAQWKGQLSKKISHDRIWASLNATEQEKARRLLSSVSPKKRENALDAIGIGQWVRSRLVAR